MADRRRKRPKPKSFGKPSSSVPGRMPPQVAPSVNQEAGEGTSSEPAESAENRFERELVWCIEQLKLGLAAPNTRAEWRQVQDAVKSLKILENPNAPMVRKRQVMNSSFGDYRKKMAEEERKYAATAKKMCLQKADSNKQQKSTFLRKSSHKNDSSIVPNGGLASATSAFEGMKINGDTTSEPFQFNFSVGDGDSGACGDGGGAQTATSTENSAASTSEAPPSNAPEPQVNFYKMEPAGGGFSFNFSIPSDT